MILTNNIEKAKQMLKAISGIKIVKAQDDAFNRKMLEYGKFDILIGLENSQRKLTLKNIDSGLSPFLCSLMAKHKISLGIDLAFIRSLKGKEQSLVLAQLMQNIKLCRKKGVNIALFGVKDEKDAKTFLQLLGASSQQDSMARIIK